MSICDKCERKNECIGAHGDEFCLNYVQKPQTNADRIRNMTDEELVNLLCLKHCPTAIDSAYKCKDIGNCKPCWEEWLKQEVSDVKGEEN